ncbi:MAG TPA: asparagine synthase (glutamine-hydrolyzing), partial [Chryseosolibacter sp.]|nr:asparagine synthase (glutamine-hydrolyzing) [Chryseosolibacter sp.]
MCGIAGFIGNGTEQDMRKMISTISHRGPDNQQVFLRDNVALGHARLTIIDLAAEANQPFFNADHSVALVFNGEIYNFLELKKTLEKQKDHLFRTSSDTEVLLALYQYYGLEMFPHLEGMFAFAIYDFNKNRLLLARDRMGEKPLYYGRIGEAFVFGSELKSLLAYPKVSTEIDPQALEHYLVLDYVPAPYSIFRDVRKLEAGTYLLFENNSVTQKKYWDVVFNESDINFETACDEFRRRLEKAVVGKMIADVPLGFFLSGGLDSSTVAYFAQKSSNKKIKTYSIGFEDKSYDESSYAKQVADLIGSDHHHEMFNEAQAVQLIPMVASKLDEPFADPSVLPTFLLTKFTRKHVTVALGGDGSDELLGGYPTFLADRFIGAVNALSLLSKPMMAMALKLMPVSDRNIGLDFKIRQFRKGVGVPDDLVHSMWLSSFTPSEAKRVRKQAAKGTSLSQLTDLIEFHLRNLAPTSRFNRNAAIYYKTYLPDDILVKVDRASMFASLEVRSPFLDHRLVEFVNNLPESYKRKGLVTKRILKESMKGKLPDNIIYRPKKGFGIPLSLW